MSDTPGGTEVALPVFIHRSIRLAKASAAAAWVGCGVASRVEIPRAAAGGAPVNDGNMPPATVVANAMNAPSNGPDAPDDSNAVVSVPVNVAAAADTAVDEGTMPVA